MGGGGVKPNTGFRLNVRYAPFIQLHNIYPLHKQHKGCFGFSPAMLSELTVIE